MEPVRFGLVGVGGYARIYFDAILQLEREGLATFGSVAIRTPGKYPQQEKVLAERNVPIRRSLDEMIEKDRERMEVVGIPTGIDSHRELMIQAAEAGLDVLLEKPTVATIQDFEAMVETLERTKRWCAIGFQSLWDTNVIGVKKLICSNHIGAVKEAVVICNWKRDDSYFSRNAWAGALKVDDKYVLDGTINNPMAHYLFNALYFVSSEWGHTAMPTTVRAELYRARDIQSEDTSCVDIRCDNGARILFYGSLNASETLSPTIELIGETGRIEWRMNDVARLYEDESLVSEILKDDGNSCLRMFRNVARYARGLDSEVYCPLAMTRAHVLAVNGAFESSGIPKSIPEQFLKHYEENESGKKSTEIIPDIRTLSARAAVERKLYSDLDVPWASKTEPFSLNGYTRFEMQT